MKWEARRVEDWFPVCSHVPRDGFEDAEWLNEVRRTWIFSKKGWLTLECLEGNKIDFQEISATDESAREIEETAKNASRGAAVSETDLEEEMDAMTPEEEYRENLKKMRCGEKKEQGWTEPGTNYELAREDERWDL